MLPPVDAPEIHRLSPRLALIQRYDPAVKADLFSTALRTESGLCLIDPFSAEEETLRALGAHDSTCAIVVTNENHLRASAACADLLRAPIFAHPDAGVPNAKPIASHALACPELSTQEIFGAPAGEVALYSAAENGTVIVGDALINMGSHGFTFLPAKYCIDHRRMRTSLRRLLDWSFERLLFAHGAPITANARVRLQALLNEMP